MFRQKLYTVWLCKETSNNKPDWTPVKYLIVLHHNRTQKQLQHSFLNMLQKYYQLPILGTLDISGHLHQKQPQLVKTLMFICMEKMNSLPNFFFWDIVKILQTYYFEYFENAWSYPAVMIVSPCRHLWCPKCWNQLVGNFDVYLHAKINFISNFFFKILWRHCKHAILGTLGMLDYPN